MNIYERKAVHQMIERFFGSDILSNSCLDGEWSIGAGGYDLVAEIYHNNIAVCRIINNLGTYEIEHNIDDEICAEVIGLVSNVFDKNNISYSSYSFTAVPTHSFSFLRKNYHDGESYSFKTVDFEMYKVTTQNGYNFNILASDLIGELFENLQIKSASEETIKKLIEKYSENEFAVSRAYGDLAVEYGLLQRVSFGEESVDYIDDAKEFTEGVGTDCIGFTYGYGKFIDDNNDTFYYEVQYDKSEEKILTFCRDYDYSNLDCSPTAEQIEMLVDKAISIDEEKTKDNDYYGR